MDLEIKPGDKFNTTRPLNLIPVQGFYVAFSEGTTFVVDEIDAIGPFLHPENQTDLKFGFGIETFRRYFKRT